MTSCIAALSTILSSQAITPSYSFATIFAVSRNSPDVALRMFALWKRVTVVHKANILKATSGLFLETAKIVAKEYEGVIACDDKIVDNAAMQLVINPTQFDVIVTTNLFGDILSDEASGLVGGLGLAPGANIGTKAAIFEAVHGSAPDIAGKGIANPSAQMLAAAMMLDHVGDLGSGTRLRRALETAIVKDGVRTKDLGGNATTAEFARAVARRV